MSKPSASAESTSSKAPTHWSLWQLLWRQQRHSLLLVIALNLATALVGIGVVAFINHYFLGTSIGSEQALVMRYALLFFALVILQLLTTFISQYALTRLGHRFVYTLRTELLKQILDTDQAKLEKVGSAKLLASLSGDILTMTNAFVRLPQLVQGIVLSIAAFGYLAWLSIPLTLVVFLWLVGAITISMLLVNKVYVNLRQVRSLQDTLYADYETAIFGHKELLLNRHRSQHFYETRFCEHADSYRRKVILADTYHLSALNWSNMMMFAAIGVLFVLATWFSVATPAVVTSFALTLLFIQSPLLAAVGAYPTLQTASVALSSIADLNLTPHHKGFVLNTPKATDWHTIELQAVSYHYTSALPVTEGSAAMSTAATRSTFGLTDINLTLRQGEVVFLIGANGSGKSTLAKLLVGLYTPEAGHILVDGCVVTPADYDQYRQNFAAIFGDGHLFDWLQGQGSQPPEDALLQTWLTRLQLAEKLDISNYQLSTTQLSQGQRKRLALLLTICEDKPILLLDEWAADQDPVYRKVFYEEIIPSLKQMGKTLFVISHDDRYFQYADRLLQMHAGKLVELDAERRQHASQDAVSHLQSL